MQSSAGSFDRWPAQQALRPHNAKSPKAVDGTPKAVGGTSAASTNGTNIIVASTNGINGAKRL